MGYTYGIYIYIINKGSKPFTIWDAYPRPMNTGTWAKNGGSKTTNKSESAVVKGCP